MVDEKIMNKIKRCLELARRGATEGEMQAAMGRVQVLLAQYNLSMTDVENFGNPEVTTQEGIQVRGVEVWHRTVYNAISKLYFCGYFYSSWDDMSTGKKRRFTRHHIIGKPSNIAIVKNMALYIIDLGDRLAEDFNKYDMRMRNSFRKGFASRILTRVNAEIEKAKKGELKEEETGKALIVHPLYVQAKNEVDRFLSNQGTKLRNVSTKIYNKDGYASGWQAGGSVSLAANGIGGNGTTVKLGR